MYYSGGVVFISILSRQKQSVSYDLSCGGWPTRRGHSRFAYAYGNHVRFYDDAYAVGMYVSYFFFF